MKCKSEFEKMKKSLKKSWKCAIREQNQGRYRIIRHKQKTFGGRTIWTDTSEM